MYRVFRADMRSLGGRGGWQAALVALALSLGGCSGTSFSMGDYFGSSSPPPPSQAPAIGTGQTKVALILPLSAQGNAGAVGLSMRNAAELAVSEFNADLQLLIKDDGGNPQGAQQAAQQALQEGAQLILGPLFVTEKDVWRAVGAVERPARPPRRRVERPLSRRGCTKCGRAKPFVGVSGRTSSLCPLKKGASCSAPPWSSWRGSRPFGRRRSFAHRRRASQGPRRDGRSARRLLQGGQVFE